MGWRTATQFKVNLSALIFGMALIVVLTKLSQYLPSQYYFWFSGFLYYHDILAATGSGDAPVPQPANFASLLIKLAIPLITGLALGVLWEDDGIQAAGAAGFGGAFILCWPAIIAWDTFANPAVLERQNQFYLLFAAYIGSFAYLCLAASRLAPGLRESVGRHVKGRLPTEITIDWSKIATELAKSALLGGLSFIIGYVAR